MSDKYDLTYKSIDELPEVTPAGGTDYVVVYDVSAGKFGKALASSDLTGVTATAAEINNVADVSARVQELTATGAVTAGVQSLELNHATVVIAATIADSANHAGFFIVKNGCPSNSPTW